MNISKDEAWFRVCAVADLADGQLRGDEVWAYIEEELTYDFDEEDDDDFEW
jgi:hypothetical protein